MLGNHGLPLDSLAYIDIEADATLTCRWVADHVTILSTSIRVIYFTYHTSYRAYGIETSGWKRKEMKVIE